MIPDNLPDQIADIYGRLADAERRDRNRNRTGTVAEVGTGENAGKYSNLRVNSSPASLDAYREGVANPFYLGRPILRRR